MSKAKKHKIAKLTDEQYVNYIMSLKNQSAASAAEGQSSPDESPRKKQEGE